jgi:hypothetical protein
MTKTRADFQCEEPPMIETLEQVKATLTQHFKIKDWQGVEIIMVTGNNPGTVLLSPCHLMKLVAAYGRGRGAKKGQE